MQGTTIFPVFLLLLIASGCGNQDLLSGDITSFKIHAYTNRSTDFEFKEKIIQKLNQQIRNPNLEFGVSNGGVHVAIKYEAGFEKDQKLRYSGALFFFQDKVFLSVYYPEDIGFPGDPNVVVCLDNVLPDNQLARLRTTFLEEDVELPTWTSRNKSKDPKK